MLQIDLAGIKLRNFLILASGVVGSDVSMYLRAWENGIGAIVTKTFTIERREGFTTPIITAVRCGYLNAVGLENPGKEGMKPVIEYLKKCGIPTIVSIAGRDVDEFLQLASIAYESNADAVELNLSCPHAKGLGLEIGLDRELTVRIIKRIKDDFDMKVFPKLGLSSNVTEIAKSAEVAGADGVVLINTIRGMKIDIWLAKPVLSNKFGGLSGPAIHPIAVAVVYQAYEHLNIPIIASGGVWDWEDVVEFLMAGAKAVQIGSVLTDKGFEFIRETIENIKNFMNSRGYKSVEELIGVAHE
ncbi:MAG: dihydroorotate dehydrogenase [Candidatus Korarchaeota archaeon]|nr:dihydroorotate dehydrogenase [Thermoproteota archaeon]MCR8455267.1 dihydroorotate dehydrogenase [Thermoproteota archaeon]MCR8463049.1 dihydroorotate dehydrogenase [Thermoproteota archaeon]MCR8470627.1 dihydroorotate dehydrogenase [Thermoproteota archaeon]MCR8471595.1 dihydroorotate dehydrogenase [Thermoproteota archaeon]